MEDCVMWSMLNGKVYKKCSQVLDLEAENEELRKRLPLSDSFSGPHDDLSNCPTFHDGCHCTVETLVHNIERADKLKADLIKYGMHLDDCPCFIPQGEWKDNSHHTKTDDELNIEEVDGCTVITVKCTCGFEQALK